MTATRIHTFTVEGPPLDLFVSDCANCGVVFGIPRDLEKRRRNDGAAFYCPNGHNLVFSAEKNAQEKLAAAEARATAAADQASAAVRDAEAARFALLRDRHRFANGVCPCCTRSFENVRRHMATKHPDYDVAKIAQHAAPRVRCSCGRTFETPRGLAIHQGHQRREGWDSPEAGSWRAHLTKVAR